MNKTMKRILSLALALLVVLGSASMALADEKPATWIADRVIQVQAYVDDIGYSLPDKQLDTPVMQELKKRTGMQIEFLYTPGDKDRYVMAAQLATGGLPDMILSYLNNSTRPEFPILLKAAKDGMFVDLAPFVKESKVYSKYLEPGFLPADTNDNIIWRKDFEGKAYLMQLAIEDKDSSTEWKPAAEYVGGMYIQSAIAKDLNLDVKSINSSEKLHELLKQIAAKGYKDASGNPVVPMGPKFWGGSTDSLDYIIRDLNWGISGGYNMTEDGKVLHEAETDWVFKKIKYLRALIEEGLLYKEFFTADETRAGELCTNKSVAIISDIHNYKPLIYETEDWIPLGPISNYRGSTDEITSGKSGYGVWAIPEGTANPGEIVKLMDYLSSKEGQMLCLYGVEGVSYDLVDGMPVLKPEVSQAIKDGDTKTLWNTYGAAFDGSGVYGLTYILTDNQNEVFFGESSPGAKSATTFARSVQLATDYARTKRLVPGLKASAFLTDLEEVNTKMSLLDYNEVLVQATYADSWDKVEAIIASFRAQLKEAGIEKFEAHVEELHKANPNLILFY